MRHKSSIFSGFYMLVSEMAANERREGGEEGTKREQTTKRLWLSSWPDKIKNNFIAAL